MLLVLDFALRLVEIEVATLQRLPFFGNTVDLICFGYYDSHESRTYNLLIDNTATDSLSRSSL